MLVLSSLELSLIVPVCHQRFKEDGFRQGCDRNPHHNRDMSCRHTFRLGTHSKTGAFLPQLDRFKTAGTEIATGSEKWR
jgi:hypothetical protein